jgi:hypothetical protein
VGTPVPFQRCLAFIIATANREFTLTAGKFVPISNKTMMNVSKCYSAFTELSQCTHISRERITKNTVRLSFVGEIFACIYYHTKNKTNGKNIAFHGRIIIIMFTSTIRLVATPYNVQKQN